MRAVPVLLFSALLLLVLAMTVSADTDSDGDRFSDNIEQFVDTQAQRACPVDSTLNNETDSWPVDFNDNQLVNGSDWISFNPHMNSHTGDPGYNVRWDLNADGWVNGSDLLQLNPYMNTNCLSMNFVQRSGSSLTLAGQPYTFIGANRYNLATTGGSPFLGCGGVFSDSELTTWFNEMQAQGVNALRIWAFQSYGSDFTRLDKVLLEAGKRGMKVIPVLENQWDSCTQGGTKWEPWYVSGYKSPYGSYSLSLRDWASLIVNRYKYDQRILMWQVMNEAEIKITNTNTCGSFTAFYDFANDMTTLVKSIDQNHLVSFGTMGGGQCGAQGSQYQTLHALPNIDVCEYHDYNSSVQAMPSNLSTRFSQCDTIGKPFIVGESGIRVDCGAPCVGDGDNCNDGDGCFTQQQRADYFDAKLTAFEAAGGDGYLIWSYRDHSGVEGVWEYDANDPLASVVASH